MKTKRCAFAAAVVLAGCTVAFLCRNHSVSEVGIVASGVVVPKPTAVGVSAAVPLPVSLATNQTASVRGTRPFVLESAVPFEKPLRLAAEALGARTVGVLASNRLLIEADPAACARLSGDGRFSSVKEYLPAAKLSPELMKALEAGAEAVEVVLVTLSAEDRLAVRERVRSLGGELLTGCFDSGDNFRARLSAEQVVRLASCGDVRWMERFVRPRLTNDYAVEPEAMNVRPLWRSDANPLGLSGAGEIISTSDSGIDTGDLETMHKDLRNQICGMTNVEGCVMHDGIGHGTHTAGSIVGDGTLSDGKIRGTAWGAKLYAWFCGKDGDRGVYTPSSVAELFRPDQENFPTYIHSASWGSSVFGTYTKNCAEIDKYVWENADFLPVFSAGNDGSGGSTIGSPAAAKNLLAVGATQNLRTSYPKNDHPTGNPSKTALFSSRGPCADGRIKPDIAAPGVGILSTRAYACNYSRGLSPDGNYAYDCGTSMSCPLTAGAMALVREWLLRNPEMWKADGAEEIPTAALMKAVVTGGARGALTPNNDQGWGRVDLAATLAPEDGRALKLVDRIPFAAGETFEYAIETTNAAPLDVQLAWIDYPGSESAAAGTAQLVNDLDLTVEQLVGGDGELRYGNGGTKPDDRNNLESVRFEESEPDIYLITVNCRKILYDHTEGGAAALYIRGAFDPAHTPKGVGRVRIRETDREYFSLDRALSDVEDGQTVEILRPVTLRKSCTVAVRCTIVATNEVAAASPVTRTDGAQLEIAPGATVTLTNLVFDESASTAVRVLAGGCLKLAADLGVTGDRIAIDADDATGFVLAGPLARPLTFRCRSAQAVGETFGAYACSYEDATNAAPRIVNSADESRETRAKAEGGAFAWQLVECPLDDAAASYADEDGTVHAYARLNRAVEGLQAALAAGADIATLVVRKSEALAGVGTLTISRDLTFVGLGDVRLIDSGAAEGSEAPRIVVDGGSLTLRNVGFEGYRGDTFIRVINGGSLVLDDGAVLRDLECPGNSDGKPYGPVAVIDGSARLCPGAEISNCRATGTGNKGGGLYLSAQAKLELAGGIITNCSARQANGGGGVYAYKGAVITVTGPAKVVGNRANVQPEAQATKSTASDLELSGADAVLKVTKPVIGGRIGVRYATSGPDFGNSEGKAFATVEGTFTDHELEGICESFFCDASAVLLAEASAAGRLLWKRPAEEDTRPQPLDPDDPDAVARVTYPGGSYVNWSSAQYAFDSLTNSPASAEATVTLLKDDFFDADIEVVCQVRFESPAGNRQALSRCTGCRIHVNEGASLTVADLDVRGMQSIFDEPSEVPVFRVDGGALTLDNASVREVRGTGNGGAGAIVVNAGDFVMRNGAEVSDCRNDFVYRVTDTGVGAGILIDNGSVARLEGGTVRNCTASRGGGVAVRNKSVVYVSGDVRIEDNARLSGEANNLMVADLSQLYLDGELTGSVGFVAGVGRNTPVFGEVEPAVSDGEAVASARRFTNDVTGDYGVVVKRSASRLLVWRDGLSSDGKYKTENGEVYSLVSDGNPLKVRIPQAQGGLVYNGQLQVGVPEGLGYEISDNVQTNAGSYQATAKLKGGYAWEDGTTDDKTIDWSIAKFVYDLSSVVFEDGTFTYDGQLKSILVKKETLPAGVTVAYYVGNGRTKAGVYTVKAMLSGADENHAFSRELTATLTIRKATYDMFRVQFFDGHFPYDGQPHRIEIFDTTGLPEGVTVSYENNVRTEIGSQTAIAHFTVPDPDNYEPISDMTAELVIEDGGEIPPPPPPGPTVTTNDPWDIAFESITRVSETSWKVVVTNRRELCWYRLIYTDDLAKGFTKTGAWEQATADAPKAWTNDVNFDAGDVKPAYFWKAEGTWGTDEIPPVPPDQRTPVEP